MNNLVKELPHVIGYIQYKDADGKNQREPVRTRFWIDDLDKPTYRNMESILKGRGIRFEGELQYISAPVSTGSLMLRTDRLKT